MSRLWRCQSSHSTLQGHAQTVKALVKDHMTGMSLWFWSPPPHFFYLGQFIHINKRTVVWEWLETQWTWLHWLIDCRFFTFFCLLVQPLQTLSSLDLVLVLDIIVSSALEKEVACSSSNATNKNVLFYRVYFFHPIVSPLHAFSVSSRELVLEVSFRLGKSHKGHLSHEQQLTCEQSQYSQWQTNALTLTKPKDSCHFCWETIWEKLIRPQSRFHANLTCCEWSVAFSSWRWKTWGSLGCTTNAAL